MERSPIPIEKIGFKNIRVFRNQQWFDLTRPLTILTGPNNSGKSTIQKMLVLLINSFYKEKNGRYNIDNLRFTGEVANQIGGFTNILSYGADKQEITLSFAFLDKIFGKIKSYLTYQKEDSGDGRLIKIELEKDGDIFIAFEYVTAKEAFRDWKEENWKKMKIPEEMYVWQIADFNNNLEKISAMIREVFISLKNKGFKQDRIFELNEKISKGEQLSEAEKELKIECESKGAIFNSREAENSNVEYGLSEWTIWNKNTRTFFEFDNLAKRACEVFNQPDEKLLFSTNLSRLVLEKDIFNIDVKEEEHKQVIKELRSCSINSKEDFIHVFSKVEKRLLGEVLKILDYNKLEDVEIEFGALAKWPNNFDRFFHPSDDISKRGISLLKGIVEEDIDKENNSEEDIENIQELTILKDFIAGYAKKKQTPKNNKSKLTLNGLFKEMGNERKCKPEEYGMEFNFITKNILSPIDSLTNNLGVFINRLAFSLQNNDKAIKRHYLIGDMSNADSLFYNAGKRYIYNKNSFGNKKDDFIRKWLGFEKDSTGKAIGFEIADNLVVKQIRAHSGKQDSEFIGVSYFLDKNGIYFPLADNGLGINHLVLLLLQIISWNEKSYEKPVIVLEEPETNMHPDFQSKLADLLVDAMNTFGIRFIVETHSVYFIQRLQYLVAKKDISSDKVMVYFFENSRDESKVYDMGLRSDGLFKNKFGTGFYDQAAKLTIDILNAKNEI